MNGYPAFYFHREKGQRKFESEIELLSAGEGWSDTQFRPQAEPATAQTTAEEEVIATAADEPADEGFHTQPAGKPPKKHAKGE